jgi:ABC-type arginine transport system ATPase subunit
VIKAAQVAAIPDDVAPLAVTAIAEVVITGESEVAHKATTVINLIVFMTNTPLCISIYIESYDKCFDSLATI